MKRGLDWAMYTHTWRFKLVVSFSSQIIELSFFTYCKSTIRHCETEVYVVKALYIIL